MENASKALMIGASVLIGILILSLGVYLFIFFSNYVGNAQEQMSASELAEFNDKYMKYDGKSNLTIQDVITVKNLALENNKSHFGYNFSTDRASKYNDLIDVYLGTATNPENKLLFDIVDETVLEQEIETGEGNISYNPTMYKCKVLINNTTGRVYKIYFLKVS